MPIITCPNCNQKFPSKYHKNRWVRWYDGKCETCGYKFELRDKYFDYVQPSHPLFNEIYKEKPQEKLRIEQQERIRKKENWKDDRETNLRLKVKSGRLRAWELNDIKHITKERNLDD